MLLRYLAETNQKFVIENLALIPKHGRYDDLYALFNTPIQEDVIELFKEQISLDVKAEKPLLLARKVAKIRKYILGRIRKLALETRLALGYSSREQENYYLFLRERIGVTFEKNISLKRYDNIPITMI